MRESKKEISAGERACTIMPCKSVSEIGRLNNQKNDKAVYFK